MVIGDRLSKELNKQINEEFASAYLYLSMGAYFDDKDLPGCAGWMRQQAREEVGHGMRIYDFIVEREGKVTLDAISRPQDRWDSPVAAFEAAYKHEQHITECFQKLMQAAREEKDFTTESFLKWFVDEQVEEEAQTIAIVKQLRMVGDSAQGLFLIDRELGQRGAE
ncbi:ferritin [Salinispira pacifica]